MLSNYGSFSRVLKRRLVDKLARLHKVKCSLLYKHRRKSDFTDDCQTNTHNCNYQFTTQCISWWDKIHQSLFCLFFKTSDFKQLSTLFFQKKSECRKMSLCNPKKRGKDAMAKSRCKITLLRVPTLYLATELRDHFLFVF